MGIATTVVGSYPKPPPEGEPFVLRRTLHGQARSEASAEEVARAQDDLVRQMVADQEDAGIDIVTDGHARWDDIVTPFAQHMAGFEIGGLLRFFDNNVYYRRPICVGEVEWRGPASVDAFRFAQKIATKPVKAVIPGPVTLARLSVDEHYRDHAAFVSACARVLSQEAFELEAAGAAHIQIDEPSLLAAPEDLELAKDAIGVVTADLRGAEVTLATYFDDAKRLGAELFDVPVDVFGLDFVSGPANMELVDRLPRDKKLQAGLVDARNTKLEDSQLLARTIDGLLQTLGADRVCVSPSAGLEFLPREKAKAKLERLSQATGKVGV